MNDFGTSRAGISAIYCFVFLPSAGASLDTAHSTSCAKTRASLERRSSSSRGFGGGGVEIGIGQSSTTPRSPDATRAPRTPWPEARPRSG